MKVADLIQAWDKAAAGQLSKERYAVQLPLEDAAKIEALAQMYPRRSREQILTDLLGAALDELVSSFPYVQGEQVIARDEEGDPVFEDVGHTPRYLKLIEEHIKRLQDAS